MKGITTTSGRPAAAPYVRILLEQNPRATNGKIAEEVGCHPAYVSSLRDPNGPPTKRRRPMRRPATFGLDDRFTLGGVEGVRYEPVYAPPPVFQFAGEHAAEGCE